MTRLILWGKTKRTQNEIMKIWQDIGRRNEEIAKICCHKQKQFALSIDLLCLRCLLATITAAICAWLCQVSPGFQMY